MQNHVVGLDVGSQNIKAAVAEIRRSGKFSLIHLFKRPSQGIRKGVVDDLVEATRSVNEILAEIKKISKNALKNVFLSIGCPGIKIQTSQGIVAVSRANGEVCQDDIRRVIQGSRAINLPSNRLILHTLVKEFVVDGVGDIKDPLGMMGSRLEVKNLIIDAFAPAVKNLTRCVESAGANIGGLILGVLADSRSVLSKNQKDLGVALVNIGFGTTSLIVYEANKLLHAAVLPVGSGNITSDLAIGLKTSIKAAEAIKLSFGSALSKEVPSRETVDLKKIDPGAKSMASRRFISEIIEIRLAEIFEFVNNELKSISKNNQLPAGVILVGGGAKMPAIVDLAKQELRLPAQVGGVDFSGVEIVDGELSSQIEDPEFTNCSGLALWGMDRMTESMNSGLSLGGVFKKIIKYFVP